MPCAWRSPTSILLPSIPHYRWKEGDPGIKPVQETGNTSGKQPSTASFKAII